MQVVHLLLECVDDEKLQEALQEFMRHYTMQQVYESRE